MWSKITAEKDRTYYWKIGFKEIFIRKTGKEWLVALKERNQAGKKLICEEGIKLTHEPEWQIVAGEKNNSLIPLPALPDRPVVVKPDHPFKVMSGKSVQLFIPVPLWIQYYNSSRKNENLFFECPSQALSSTWVGEPDGGTLAYSTNADFLSLLLQPAETFHYIICPVKLTNDSQGVLDIQRLLLEVEYLAIYAEGDKLFTNEIRMKFKGENEITDVQFGGQAPAFLEKPVQLSPPQSTKSKSVITKSLHFIKSLTNY